MFTLGIIYVYANSIMQVSIAKYVSNGFDFSQNSNSADIKDCIQIRF